MVTLCSKHKNDPSKGQIGRGKHPKRRKTITLGTNSGILLAHSCVPGGIYRPEFLKLNLIMTARHYHGQWSMCCPNESVTPKPCSWGSLAQMIPKRFTGKTILKVYKHCISSLGRLRRPQRCKEMQRNRIS
jgi:hypothetical protein